jgi:hypothetical protein
LEMGVGFVWISVHSDARGVPEKIRGVPTGWGSAGHVGRVPR